MARTTTNAPADRLAVAAFRVLVGGAVLLGVLLALAFTTTGSAQAAAPCSLYWTGNTSYSWTVASNWSTVDSGGGPGHIPGGGDMVCMSTAPTRSDVIYSSLTRVVGGVDFSTAGSVRPSLTMLGSSLTIGSGAGSFDSTVNDAILTQGARLGGTADVTLTGSPELTDDSTLDGAGTTTLAAGTTVSTNGLILDNGRRLINSGSLTHVDCYDDIYLYAGSVLENDGTFTGQSSCGLVVYSDGSSGARVVNDPGALLKVVQSGADGYELNAVLDNRGTVRVDQGSLSVVPLSTTSGSYILGAGAVLSVADSGYLKVLDATITGAGSVSVVPGGTVDVVAGTTLDELDLGGGTVKGSPTVTILTGGGGSTFTGGGTFTIPAAGTATIDGLTISGGSTLRNSGRISHTGCGDIDLRSGSTLENAGVFAATMGCDSAVTTDGSPGTALVNDVGGVFTVAMNTTIETYAIEADLDNDGGIEVTKGDLNLLALTNQTGGTLGGGTYTATGGDLQLPSAVVTNAASIVLQSTGEILLPSGAAALAPMTRNTGTLTLGRTVALNNAFTNTGSVSLTGGQLSATTYTQTAGTTTVAAGAILHGNNGGNSVLINGGVLTGAGTLNALTGSGTIRPSVGAGPLTSNGFDASPNGTLAITVNGPTAPEYSQLSGGNMGMDGTLAITTAAGYTPAVGSTYKIVSAGTRTGSFSAVTGTGLPLGRYYDIGYSATAVTLTVRGLPAVSVNDASQSVGDAGPAPMTFTVSLSAASSLPVTVHYATADGTATAGSDYVAASGTLTFPAGTTNLPLVVMISQDSGPEPDQTFQLRLSAPTNSVLDVATGTGTIQHQDSAPTAPVVTDLTPGTAGIGSVDRVLTINGRNFLSSSVVTVSGTGLYSIRTAFVSGTAIRLTINVNSGAALGVRDVTVTNAGIGTDTCTGCLRITPKPLPDGASTSLGAGATARTVTVTGANFVPGAVVKMTGQAGVSVLSTTFVSVTSLRLSVSVGATAAITNYDIKVINGDGGIGICTGCFTVKAAPSVVAITPPTVVRGTTTSVVITGSHFVAGLTVTGPEGVTFANITVVNSTTINARMTVSSTRGRGTGLKITVTNPAAGGYGVGSCTCLAVTV